MYPSSPYTRTDTPPIPHSIPIPSPYQPNNAPPYPSPDYHNDISSASYPMHASPPVNGSIPRPIPHLPHTRNVSPPPTLPPPPLIRRSSRSRGQPDQPVPSALGDSAAQSPRTRRRAKGPEVMNYGV